MNSLPPVDTTKVYRRRNETAKDSIDECYIPSTSDLFEDWNEIHDISELNLVMGIGSQIQKTYRLLQHSASANKGKL
ncbi:hypothetical protein Hanom_Chr04g00339281 [Helianthus anomalus]